MFIMYLIPKGLHMYVCRARAAQLRQLWLGWNAASICKAKIIFIAGPTWSLGIVIAT